jgi:hypothetical protein
MSNNGQDSYQKYDGASGTYQTISSQSDNGNDLNGPRPWSKARKWLVGVVLVAILGTVYGVTATRVNPKKAVDKALASDKNVKVKANGKLKLFDEYSTWKAIRFDSIRVAPQEPPLTRLFSTPTDRYVMEDYDGRSTFSSFLPGVAGYFGKPVWAFYVNRGQALATFGTESKDYPILEFNAANKAYQVTPYWGFRTFVRGTRSAAAAAAGEKQSFQIEPFSPALSRNLMNGNDDAHKPKRILFVGTNEVEIQEIDGAHGITTNVNYFILPEETFASLIRRTTFTNTGDSDLTIDVLDGLARMEPYGGALDGMLKNMGRTLEGWMGVYHADETLTMPFYKLSTEPSDTASVKIEEAGHYCLSFIEDKKVKATLLPIVFDTNKVFGADTSLQLPAGLSSSSVDEILENPQYGWAKTSSAFAAVTKITLKPGQNVTMATVFGKADHIEKVPQIANTVTAPNYVDMKFKRARTLINELTESVETETVNPLFDGTAKQMFLDNILRGGIPTILGDVAGGKTYDEDPTVKVYHSFSRIHGDLERDYNAFKIEPTYFSQGPGNFRDVAQNRRNDVTFFPRMGSFNVQLFLSYIQADGYEPLTVEAVVYRFRNPKDAEKVAEKLTADPKSAEVLGKVLNGGPFRPGQLFELCDQLGIIRNLQYSDADFINEIVKKTEDRAMGLYGTGYWGDHWDYYIDLIETYISIFPDGEEALMYDTSLRYFFSTATVKPRSEKYVLTLTYDASAHHVLQLDSTYWDQDKAAEQSAFVDQNTGLMSIEANWQRTKDGEPFMSSAIAKLFHLGAIKYAMRDAWGMGIEYEGGRPGWLDSMNGLPGTLRFACSRSSSACILTHESRFLVTNPSVSSLICIRYGWKWYARDVRAQAAVAVCEEGRRQVRPTDRHCF